MKRFIVFLAIVLLGVGGLIAVDAAVGPQGYFGILASGRALISDANGALQVTTQGVKATYAATGARISPAATPTDVVTLRGSASKTIVAKHITVCGSSGNSTAFPIDVTLVHRTAIDVNGTSSNATISKFDTSDANSTAMVKAYSANPATLGAGKNVRSKTLAVPASTSAGCVDFDFATRNDKPVYLRGASQLLAVYLNGQAITASSKLSYEVEWEETAE
jgi:hypothetical protein